LLKQGISPHWLRTITGYDNGFGSFGKDGERGDGGGEREQHHNTHHFVDIDEQVARQLRQAADPVQRWDLGVHTPDEALQREVV